MAGSMITAINKPKYNTKNINTLLSMLLLSYSVTRSMYYRTYNVNYLIDINRIDTTAYITIT